MSNLKIFHFSDTHSFHGQLYVPPEADILIFSGDESNYHNPVRNLPETLDFIEWYSSLPNKHKIFVAGNHSSAIHHKLVSRKEIEDKGIIYLENESTEVEGLKIWGSPISPTFGDWYFMRARGKIYKVWETIPEDTDILVTHTPPSGKLDLAYSRDNKLEFCGCRNLLKNVYRVKPKLHCFGHLHTNEDIVNAGVVYNGTTHFSNGSVVTDGRFGTLTSRGNLFELENDKIRII